MSHTLCLRAQACDVLVNVEASITGLQKEIEAKQADQLSLNADSEGLKALIKELTADLAARKDAHADIVTAVRETKKALATAEHDFKKADSDAKDKQTRLERVTKQAQKERAKATAARTLAENIRTGNAAAAAEAAAARAAADRGHEARLAEARADVEQERSRQKEAEEVAEEATETQRAAQDAVDVARKRTAVARDRLNRASSAQSPLDRVHPQLRQLLAQVRQRHPTLKFEGPLCAAIKVKDAAVAFAVETSLGKDEKTFVVTNMNDSRIL